ncbi:hypothetical protein [Clostridium sp. ZS1]|nr:hypothetical protein [Clostridium sp. ZS1]
MADNKGKNGGNNNTGKSINESGGIGKNPPPPRNVRPGFPGGKNK